jgi:acyl dehydratase
MMPLDPGAVGFVSEPITVSWTSFDGLLYAVGVGAGTADLRYTTENSDGLAQQLLPTFPVVLPGPTRRAFEAVGPFDRTGLVHGSHSLTLHDVLPVEGQATVVARVAEMWDKGNAAVVVVDTDATSTDGQPLYTTRGTYLIRGAGGWGGERGPGSAPADYPERPADAVITYPTSPDQALTYRLSGDRNPLHSDPSFAARAGFDRPILHGLCTYGFTGRALLESFGGDPHRFRHLQGRFTAPVFPGEELTITAWQIAEGEAQFRTAVGSRTVMDGRYRFSTTRR